MDYFSWARSMKMELLSKNKLGFIDESYPAWRRANVLVLGWLIHSVQPDISQRALWLDSRSILSVRVWLRLTISMIRSPTSNREPCLFLHITQDSRSYGMNKRCIGRYRRVFVTRTIVAKR
ncbi:hypothetical protein LINPERHAP1_LOCUS8381 [Linum perenne]